MAVEMQDEVVKQTVEEEDGTISQAPEVGDVTVRQSQEEEGWNIRRSRCWHIRGKRRRSICRRLADKFSSTANITISACTYPPFVW